MRYLKIFCGIMGIICLIVAIVCFFVWKNLYPLVDEWFYTSIILFVAGIFGILILFMGSTEDYPDE